ncbi:alpha/beta hydrolase [bacterium]|nr:alpha/beta hydrolase [bacterium]
MTAPTQARVNIRADIEFGMGGGRALKCDVFEPPAGTANGTGVLLIHGGGWSGGDRTQLRGYGILLGRCGYLCVASEYRLTGESLWPAQIEDVKAAIRWMRTNADELGIDPERIVISGNSAGGHLSLVAAGTSSIPEFEGVGGNAGVSTNVAACIAFYPPTGLDKRQWGGLPSLFGRGASTETLRTASPLTYATADFPPTLLIQGNADDVVPAAEATAMYDALLGHGVAVELHMYAHQPHGFDADPHLGRQCADIMMSFLQRTLP